MWWHGIEGAFNIMIMDMLGPCLEDLFNFWYVANMYKEKIASAFASRWLISHVHIEVNFFRECLPNENKTCQWKRLHKGSGV